MAVYDYTKKKCDVGDEMELKITDDPKYYNQCLEIRKEVFVEEQNVPLELEVDEYEKESVNILLTLDDRPLGTVRYRDMGDGLIKVERMAVRKIARGLHLGQTLMNFVHIHAKENGYTRAKLSAQMHAIKFYEKLGYHVSSDEFDDAGIPHKYMEKEL